ncbi:MAG: hypothetical protein WAZ18_06420, partial [Alphaproteobacteria bacterium]
LRLLTTQKDTLSMKAFALAALAAISLAACAQQQCVQPDPVQPAVGCWNKGLDCGTGISDAEVTNPATK